MNKVDISGIDSWDIKFRPMFGKIIEELAEKNEDIVLVVADSGRACRCDGLERCPAQFVDCGIAEQNMTGVAAGLARSGKKPVTFAFAPFASERCFEQVRLDIAYSGLKIVVVGSEGGVGDGNPGSHPFRLGGYSGDVLAAGDDGAVSRGPCGDDPALRAGSGGGTDPSTCGSTAASRAGSMTRGRRLPPAVPLSTEREPM